MTSSLRLIRHATLVSPPLLTTTLLTVRTLAVHPDLSHLYCQIMGARHSRTARTHHTTVAPATRRRGLFGGGGRRSHHTSAPLMSTGPSHTSTRRAGGGLFGGRRSHHTTTTAPVMTGGGRSGGGLFGGRRGRRGHNASETAGGARASPLPEADDADWRPQIASCAILVRMVGLALLRRIDFTQAAGIAGLELIATRTPFSLSRSTLYTRGTPWLYNVSLSRPAISNLANGASTAYARSAP
jgi:hypothetical protein